MPVSLAPKPEPLTVIEVPTVPDNRLLDITAPIVKLTGVVVPAGVEEPKALIGWAPEAEAGALKEAVQEPVLPAVMPEATGLVS